jgi:hypothetical protein
MVNHVITSIEERIILYLNIYGNINIRNAVWLTIGLDGREIGCYNKRVEIPSPRFHLKWLELLCGKEGFPC